jgi:alkylresorcinol/alkylpyrone synthase
MSSVTVLYILEKVLDEGIPKGKYGLLTPLGPGFSSQSLLLRG